MHEEYWDLARENANSQDKRTKTQAEQKAKGLYERFETVGMNLPCMKNVGTWQGKTQIHKTREPKHKPNKRQKVSHLRTQTPHLPMTLPKSSAVPAEQQTGNADGTGPSNSAEANTAQREPSNSDQAQRETAPPQREQQATTLQREPQTPTAAGETPVQAMIGTHHSRQGCDNCICGTCGTPRPFHRERADRNKTHQSISQQKKRLRFDDKESTKESQETASSLEQRRRELDLALHTYHTKIARKVHAEELVSQSISDNPFAFAATLADEDTMYLHKARKQKDWKQFKKAMKKELKDHAKGGHWKVIPRMPKGQKVMRGVWSMKRKRRVGTGEIYKWKARLCINGSSQKHGVNYWETYSPVVSWETVRSLLTLAIINGWETRQIDFVLAFPQAKVECPMFMEVPQGCNVNGSRKDYVLSIQKNLYGAKQASRVWFNFLKQGLRKRGFKASKVDEAVFYKGNTIFIVYVDDGIFIGPDKKGNR